ncbi:MAG TPA: hypothetical protein VFM25_05420, partial [Verrucomicrobiae bacterium]|nr:hypothetical protein [Verrucomicrobiae bacterium]
MKTNRHFASFTRRFLMPLAPAVLLTSPFASADTLYFYGTSSNQNWFSQDNWYYSISREDPADHLPGSEDTVILMTSPVLIGPNSVSVNTMIIEGVAVGGGDISVLTLRSEFVSGSPGTSFNDSTVHIQNEWDIYSGATLNNSTVDLDLGAFILLEPGSSSGNTDLSVNNSTIYNEGQIVLTDQSGITFASGTNHFSILPNAVVSGSGNSYVINNGNAGSIVIFDNNGTVRADAGTLSITLAGTVWTNSLGTGKYTTSATNAVLEFFNAFTLNAGNTNRFNGPGLIWFYNNVSGVVNGKFQVGESNVVPGKVQFDGSFSGTGSVQVAGTTALPSQLIWDNGTISGLPVNIDAKSQLLVTNASTKTLSGGVINNAGSTTWTNDTGNL